MVDGWRSLTGAASWRSPRSRVAARRCALLGSWPRESSLSLSTPWPDGRREMANRPPGSFLSRGQKDQLLCARPRQYDGQLIGAAPIVKCYTELCLPPGVAI